MPNLAGLTRTCEVFAAEALVLADLRVLKDPQFMPISVTAEQHVLLKVHPEPSTFRLKQLTESYLGCTVNSTEA